MVALRWVAAFLVMAGFLATGCSDDNDTPSTPTVSATRSATADIPPTADPPQSVSTPQNGVDEVEVQGVVGAVDTRTSTIEIRATGGSSIEIVDVTPATAIHRAGGGTLELADVRASDRILATGVIEGDPSRMTATEVTVQQVVPGGPPGANPGG